MNQSESIDKLAGALVAAQADMPGIAKSGNNTFDKYTYAKLEDYVRAAHPILAKHGLGVVSSPESAESLPERKTKNGGSEYPVRVTVRMRIIHTSGQWIEVSACGEGQDRGDKGLYKAITGARKYGIASLFGLATTDDPEGTDGDGNPTGGNGQAAPPARRDTPKQNGTDPSTPFVAAVKVWSGLTDGKAIGEALRRVLASKNFKDKASVPSDAWPSLVQHVENLKDEYGEYAKFASK